MQGVTTQVYYLERRTACTTALKKKIDTRVSDPYLLRILVIPFHTAFARDKFLTTAIQSSSAADITRPRYRKEVIIYRGCPYVLNALEVTALSSFATNNHCFQPAPFLSCYVCRCIPFSDFHSTSISHRGHRGWGRLPSSSITTVSQAFQCNKCTRITVQVTDITLHPSTGQGLSPAFTENAILKALGSFTPPYLSPS